MTPLYNSGWDIYSLFLPKSVILSARDFRVFSSFTLHNQDEIYYNFIDLFLDYFFIQ